MAARKIISSTMGARKTAVALILPYSLPTMSMTASLLGFSAASTKRLSRPENAMFISSIAA